MMQWLCCVRSGVGVEGHHILNSAQGQTSSMAGSASDECILDGILDSLEDIG